MQSHFPTVQAVDGHQVHQTTCAHLVWVESEGLTLVLRLIVLSGRLGNKKLITTHTREHSGRWENPNQPVPQVPPRLSQESHHPGGPRVTSTQ